ncbi:5'-3' exonuclease PLD3 [Trichonephila clavata]|uniref:5'-3' exonuclease PLD3 n=1 Tax=Trichonephila clavata TaxID=2740835 RepID=A0A8X6G215_TRICU|nr:5'-3' exonuclease PLD3 [Trichonephila clavata]
MGFMTVVERTGKLDVGEFELQLFDSRYMLKGETEEKKCKGWLKPSCIPITIILALIILVVLLPLIGQDEAKSVEVITLGDYDAQFKNCSSPCVITLVESIPENLTFAEGEPTHTSVFESWSQLISLAERSIDIATFYSTLKGQDIQPDDPDPSSWQGDKIFNDLMKAGTDRGIRIRIIQSEPTGSMPDFDTKELEVKGAAKVRSLDFKKMLGNGVLHTKMFLIDKKHFYIGSANMDWRSLTQVKELGIVIYNCSCLALDINKIFEVYWKLGVPNPYIPPEWPADLQTSINKDNPVTVIMNNSQILTYISSSPPPLCPKGRTTDLDSILDCINRAHTFVYIAVMDYFPTSLYMDKDHYWPAIDDALRRVTVVKRLQVRILASYWNHTKPTMMSFLRSLHALNSDVFDIEVKIFVVPTYTEAQAKIPFSRVNHNKYMVTDNAAYIGTSNWSEDYFVNTGGVGIVLRNSVINNTEASNPIREQVEEVFKRDWASEYAHPLSQFQDITDINCLVGTACEMPQTTTEPITIKPPMNEDALKGHGLRIHPMCGIKLMILAYSGKTICSSRGLLLKIDDRAIEQFSYLASQVSH